MSEKEPRLAAADYRRLKSRFGELCESYGTQTEASRWTRADQTLLSRYASTNGEHPKTFAPIDVVAELEHGKRPIVSELLAELSGHMLVPVPRALFDGSDLSLALGELGREIGDVFSDLSKAFSDGTLTAAEHNNGKRQIADAHRALAVLDALLDARLSRQGEAAK